MKDGNVYMEHKDLITKDFKSENELRNYIIDHIEEFAVDILDDKLISFQKEKLLTAPVNGVPVGRRVDLYVVCEKGNYVVELKNPKSLSGNTAGIGQLLNYGRMFKEEKQVKLVLITTMYDPDTMETIKYYDLPIRYIYMDKQRMLEPRR